MHTHDVCGCASVPISARWSLDSARWPFPWTVWVILAHVGCLFSTHRTSVGVRQLTQDVCGCPWLSVAVHQHTQDVCVCPSAHTGRPWLSISTHTSTLVVGLSTLTLPESCLGDFGPRGLSVQYTEDVCGCPPAHIGPHTGRPWLSISTHISTLVLGLRTLALPVDCSGDFGPCGLSVQYTQDVCGCPSAHTGRPCVSVSTHRMSVALSVCVVSTHRPSVAVHQYTYQHVGPRTPHADPFRGLFGTHMTSVAVHQYTYQHVGPWTQHAGPSVDCLGDFGPYGLSVQYTQDIRGCPPAHTGRLWLSVAGHQHTQDVCGCLCVSLGVCQHTQDVHVCPWVSVSTHRTSVCVRQHTQEIRGCLCVSVCVRVCPSAHTRRLWLSISTHISMLVLGLSALVLGLRTLAHVGCLFSTHRTSVGVRQHTQEARGCPWLSVSTHNTSVAVRVFTWVFDSTHRTSMAIRQNTQDVRLFPSAHIGRPCVRLHTQNVRVSHTGRLWLSVCVRVRPSAHTGCTWLSISTHINTLVLGHSRLAPPVDCSGDFGPRGLSVQYTQDVCGCPSAHTGRLWVSVSTHRTSVGVRQHKLDVCVCLSAHTGRPWLVRCVSVCVCQHTQDVRGCPSVHISARWSLDSARWPFPWTVWMTLAHVGCRFSTHRTSMGVRQHTQDVCVCPWVSVSTHRSSVCVRQHTQEIRGCPCVSMCVRLCPSAHTRRLWLSISTHTSTLVLGLSMLALPVDCSGDFGPRGLSVQYTQDVRGCPPAHTGHPWLSITHRTSVGVRQHTQNVCGCPWLFVSTHISTLVLGPSTLTFPVDCWGDFGPRGLSVQYTQVLRGCPPAHTGRPWLSVAVCQHTQDVRGCTCLSESTHMTSVAVHQYTYQLAGPWTLHAGPSRGLFGRFWHTWPVCSVHIGRLWVSASTHRTSVAVRGCPSAHTRRLYVSVSTYRTSVAVHQYTYQHIGPWSQHADPSRGLFGTSLAVRVCLSVSVSTHRTFVAVHQYTYQHVGPWTRMLTLPMDCSGDFGPRGLSVQYTQNVRGCPSEHTGRPWLSVCFRQNTGRSWLSISTHISTLVLGLSTLTLPKDCSSDFGPHGLSVQYTQDVRGFPPAHTGRPWRSMCVCLCQSAHTGRSWLSISTHISTLVLGISTLALPVDGFGDFGPCGLSVQYTQDFRGCPSAHTRCLWLFVCVRVCPSAHRGRPWVSISTPGRPCVSISTHPGRPCVSLSTHRTSVAVHQYTYQHAGPWTQHAGPSRGLFGTHKTSVAIPVCPCVFVCVRVCPSAHTGRLWLSISTHISMLVLGLSMLALPVDCSGDFGPRGLSFQYTKDVRGCPSAHTGRPCVSVSTHRTSVAVHQYTYQHVGPWTQHADPSRGLFGRFWPTWAVCSIHRGPHTGRQCLSISIHIITLVLGRQCLALPVDGLGDFGPRGLSVQYTQDVCGCPPAHTGHPWLSVCVPVCLSAHTGRPWLSISTHISTLVLGISTLALPVDCAGDFGPRGLSVQCTKDVRGCPPTHTRRLWLYVAVRQHTQDVRGCPCVSVCVRHHTHDDVCGCPPAHTGRPWLFVCVRVCLSAHTGPPWLSISTHISTLVLGLSTLALPEDCSGDFGPRGPSVQYTQDVRVCPLAHTGRHPWPSVCVPVCLSAHTGRSWLSISTHISTLVLGLSMLTLPMDCSGDFGPRGLSVQYTQDVRGCLSEHTGRPCVSLSKHRTSVAVRVFPSAHTGRSWLSISTHIRALVLGLSMLTLPVDCSGDFGPRGLSVQYTQDVCGCPPAHTGCPWLSVCVRLCPSAHTGRPCLSISTYIITLVLGLSTLALPVDCSGDFSPRVLCVQYTQDVRGCPPAHTGCPWLSVCVCGCPSAHTKRPWLSISTHISMLVLPLADL
ncbi:hypothetical protein IGI04_036031 [Brassica rapa subsp. trilocularis]|uniref:Uncharacterized protein n=1 Tax=Brassica rapa subsp. trilocularis TaxID=1813537 RepID=A0ABQ7LH45_BRACM|nr:hypothetical protein IGI04_036031 [Brassica rapa subsp. trilocularis]